MRRHLTAATGYVELGMWEDAWDELEAIPADERHVVEVLALQLQIFWGVHKWESAATLAESMIAKGVQDGALHTLGA